MSVVVDISSFAVTDTRKYCPSIVVESVVLTPVEVKNVESKTSTFVIAPADDVDTVPVVLSFSTNVKSAIFIFFTSSLNETFTSKS